MSSTLSVVQHAALDQGAGHGDTLDRIFLRQAAASHKEMATAADVSRQELLQLFDDWCANSLGDSGTPAIASPGGGAGDDPMDEDEQFEQMQIAKVMAEEPESLAFVRARNAAHGRKSRR